MALAAGTRLGPYEITAPLGAGGMGEVYRAHDTKLNRDVAIKVLPDEFAADPDRLVRFQREAHVLASLNHPNIAQIHGLEETDGVRALVLELVDGPTLADRIAEGPIPLEEALPIATQIAEALEAAHDQGVIHRDLKPANIKVRADGTVKVLDFGLAKAFQPDATDPNLSASPTISLTAATQMGMVMGTAAYMAPEQAKGKLVDRRADIWAFGAVLYEMLAGKRAFAGEDVSDTLVSIFRDDPAWSSLPDDTPARIHQTLRICLQKDPKQRVRDISAIRLALEGAFETAMSDGRGRAEAPLAEPALWQRPVFAAGALGLALITGGLAVWSLMRSAPLPPAPITRTSIVLPPTQVRTNTGRRGVAISPTGTHVAYVANQQLYLRALDELEAQPLAGTEGSAPTLPLFSPDGQWIAFYSTQDGALKKVALSGGAAVTLTGAGNPFGASWGANDTIVFGQFGLGILQVAGAGGTADVLVSVESPDLAHQPQMLPGAEAVLYTLGSIGQWDAAQIVVEQVATGERTVVVERGSDVRYLPTGHLVYALGGTLLAMPFDLERLEVTGGPVPLVEGVSRATATGAANADIGRTGALVYLPSEGTGGAVRTLVWVDRDGTEDVLAAPPRDYFHPRLSPDGTQVALNGLDQEDDVWIWDLTRETLTRFTFAAEADRYPEWTPDGQRVVFASTRGGAENLYWRAADGTGTVERLTESPSRQFPNTISPDGTRLVLSELSPDTGFDLYVLTLDGDRRVEPLIVTEFGERNAEISPDGRWVAYQSDASGREEIFVQPFPNVDAGRWQISTTGGTKPLWGPEGRELFYRTDAGVMGVTVETGVGFEASTPALVVEGAYFETSASIGSRSYDISPDGQRFLMLTEGAPTNPDDTVAGLTQIHVVLNWDQELLERVPVP